MVTSEVQRLKSLLNSSFDGIFATDLQLNITEWNHQMVRFSGVQKQDCLGASLTSLFPTLEDSHLIVKLKKVLRGHFEVIKGMPFNKVLQHGINEFYEGYYSPVYNENGEITGLMGVVREIGLRKHAGEHKKIEENSDPFNKDVNNLNFLKISEKHNELIRIVNRSPAIAFSCFIDQERTINFISDNIKQLGYNASELMLNKASFKKLIAPTDYDNLEKAYRNYVIADEGENFITEYRVLTPMGNERWIQERSWLVKNENNETNAMEGVLVDISVKKFAEEALFASKEHFRLIFEQAPIGMAIINRDGSFSRVNHAFLRLSGYTENDMHILKAKDVLHAEEMEMAVKNDEAIFNRDSDGYKEERRLITKNREVLYTIEQGAPLYSGNEHVQKLIQVVDITSRKIAENNLLESKNRIRQAQKFARLGGWEYLIDSRQLILSPEIYEFFGLDPEQNYAPDYFIQFIEETIYQELILQIRSFLADDDQEEINQELTITKEGLQARYVQVKAAKIKQQAKTVKVFGFIQDITELKDTEMNLRTRNHELTNFVYKISHDLRAPLSSISGLLNLLKVADEDNKQYLEMIKNRIMKLDNFISDILAHSRNLYTAISVERVDLEGIVRSCLDELSYLKNLEKIQPELEIHNHEFFCDKNRVKDIFKNIIANAIQYINPSKDQNLLQIKISFTDSRMEAEFIDNGVGIDPKTLPRVFDIFFRGSDTSTGSGIGLYIVKQSVEKLNGRIHISSNTRKGTRVMISLPNMKDHSLSLNE